MTNTTTAWFVSLTDSVSALGIAAREYRVACQSAHIAAWHVEPVRMLPVDGVVIDMTGSSVSPHDDALRQLGELYTGLRLTIRDLYQNTALAYAHGTAAALHQVLAGQRPAYVELPRSQGRYELPTDDLPDLLNALRSWTETTWLDELRERVLDRQIEAFSSGPEGNTALADAAFAYGEKAEGALHHVLLGTRVEDLSEEEK